MDTLRTQKVRCLTEFYNKLKSVTQKEKRFELIQSIECCLDRTKNRAVVAEVIIEIIYYSNNGVLFRNKAI